MSKLGYLVDLLVQYLGFVGFGLFLKIFALQSGLSQYGMKSPHRHFFPGIRDNYRIFSFSEFFVASFLTDFYESVFQQNFNDMLG